MAGELDRLGVDVAEELMTKTIERARRGNLRATDTLAFKALHLAAAAKAPVVDANHIALARSQVLS